MTDLVEKYRELRGVLADLAGRTLSDLVEVLLPADNEGCAVLREVGLLAITQVEDIGGLFDRIRTHITQPEMPEEGDFVRVMSLHKSKGLTSRVVIVAGCTRGLIPFEDSDQVPLEQLAILQEQRRLFYVAITRCSEVLVLSSAAHMDRKLAWAIGAHLQPGRSKMGTTIASQFIDELGPTAPAALRGDQWANSGYIT